MFEAAYENLVDAQPAFGRIAILPWDTEIFGFPVADYKPGQLQQTFDGRREVVERLRSWAAAKHVELIGCSVPSGERTWRTLLPQFGFTYVDATLTYTLAKLQIAKFPRKHVPVRLATIEDQSAVERICEIGFRAGRYHADPRFPLELANARYRHWLTREFKSLGEANRIYVAGEVGSAVGFTHVRVTNGDAYITIGGADPAVQSGVLPFAVFIGTLEALRDSGVRRAQSKLSAGNTPMLNLAAYAGSRFSEPETVFHWHAADAPHLVPIESLAP
ncbi:MAG: hypothetical protein H0T11_09750 [Chthoniobacterales bacterium]|nr:hypothetical protein [Chthoniobacterales bacterium]